MLCVGCMGGEMWVWVVQSFVVCGWVVQCREDGTMRGRWKLVAVWLHTQIVECGGLVLL